MNPAHAATLTYYGWHDWVDLVIVVQVGIVGRFYLGRWRKRIERKHLYGKWIHD